MVETRSQRKAKEAGQAASPESNGSATTSNGNGKHCNESMDATTISSNNTAANEDASTMSKVAKEVVKTPRRSKIAFLLICIISYAMFPQGGLYVDDNSAITWKHVWYYGWITAVSTGLGVLPLVFVRDGELDTFYIGVSNAIASGMMIAASYSLILEGVTFTDVMDISDVSCVRRTCLGILLGVMFLLGTKSFLDQHEDLKVGGLSGADARKVMLIIFVMTLHSFSEGVGIGVSFGGDNGDKLGMFISASLAVHNIPEGLAVAIVLLPRRVSKLTASMWCIATSLPQPLMAVPAFMFVNTFVPILPIGLGFAGGAMAFVAVFELLVEAYEDTESVPITGSLTVAAFAGMMYLQNMLHGDL